jgi:hypothetical protein
MTNLSPAAQAVLAASHTDPQVVADILLAVVDQVVPTEMDLPPIAPDLGHFRQHERRLTRQRLLAIAEELENTND